MEGKGFVKGLVIAAVILVLLILVFPVSCVGKSDRGIKVRMGAVVGDTLQPGPKFRMPFVESIQTYSIQPQMIQVNIPVGAEGAITKDNQTVGVNAQLFYRLISDRVPEIAKNWSEEKLRAVAGTTAITMTKVVLGQYTIFEVAEKQAELMKKAFDLMVSDFQAKNYPIELVDYKLSNYDWSDDFDNQIKETMNKAQQVNQKKQEVLLAELDAEKEVKQAEMGKQAKVTRAEGDKAAAITAAEGEKEAARLHAEAKALEGEGIKKYNQSVAVNWEIELQKMKLEIEKLRVEKWNGQYVPNNNYGPIPVDTVGGIKGQ